MSVVLIEHVGDVAVLTLNRPEAYNALNEELLDGLGGALSRIAMNPGVRGVVITGAGKAFCSGGDLKVLQACEEGPKSGFHRLAGRFHAAVTEIRRMAKPVVAAVNGVAAGGGFSLALAADFRVLGKSSVVRCAYLAAGLSLDGGGTWTLPRIVGHAKALEIAVLDAPINAEQALALGLATRVVEDNAVVEEARALAQQIASTRSMHSCGWTKRLLMESMNSSFEAQLERERDGIATCGSHPDGVEGMAAFAQKRSPKFNA